MYCILNVFKKNIFVDQDDVSERVKGILSFQFILRCINSICVVHHSELNLKAFVNSVSVAESELEGAENMHNFNLKCNV